MVPVLPRVVHRLNAGFHVFGEVVRINTLQWAEDVRVIAFVRDDALTSVPDMQAEMEAERRSRAIVATAKGNAAGEVLEAEAHAKAIQIRAEGDAMALARIAEAETFYLTKLKESVGEKEA